MNTFSFEDVSVDVLSNLICRQMIECSSHKQMAFHQCGFEHALVEAMAEKRIYHMFHIYRVMYVCVCAFSGRTMTYILWHKIYMRTISVFDWYNEAADA